MNHWRKASGGFNTAFGTPSDIVSVEARFGNYKKRNHQTQYPAGFTPVACGFRNYLFWLTINMM